MKSVKSSCGRPSTGRGCTQGCQAGARLGERELAPQLDDEHAVREEALARAHAAQVVEQRRVRALQQPRQRPQLLPVPHALQQIASQVLTSFFPCKPSLSLPLWPRLQQHRSTRRTGHTLSHPAELQPSGYRAPCTAYSAFKAGGKKERC